MRLTDFGIMLRQIAGEAVKKIRQEEAEEGEGFEDGNEGGGGGGEEGGGEAKGAADDGKCGGGEAGVLEATKGSISGVAPIVIHMSGERPAARKKEPKEKEKPTSGGKLDDHDKHF